QLLLVEDLGDEAGVAQGGDVAALAGGDPGRLLAAVLQRVEAEVGEAADVVARRVDAEHPAFVAWPLAVCREPQIGIQERAFPRCLERTEAQAAAYPGRVAASPDRARRRPRGRAPG